MARAPAEAVTAAREFGVVLEGEVEARLSAYLELLLEANAHFNLTAITDLEDAWTKHVVDSLSLCPELRPLTTDTRIVDVGAGGGLPGIPLAIARPDLRFTLLEATGKKARFLRETSERLDLANVDVVSARAEDFGRGAGRAKFEVATARAVSRLPVLVELMLPLVTVGGFALAIKGEQAAVEIAEASRALELLHGTVEHTRRTATGTIVRIRKDAETPNRYPRRPGEPKRAPL